jgi:hypothetical protein
MKVNPVSIQAYQQLTRRETPATQTESSQKSAATDRVVIEPQKNTVGSSLAVKAPSGTYAEYLTPEENQALEMLFAKFRGTAERLGSGYQDDVDNAGADAHVGRMIDVKV